MLDLSITPLHGAGKLEVGQVKSRSHLPKWAGKISSKTSTISKLNAPSRVTFARNLPKVQVVQTLNVEPRIQYLISNAFSFAERGSRQRQGRLTTQTMSERIVKRRCPIPGMTTSIKTT